MSYTLACGPYIKVPVRTDALDWEQYLMRQLTGGLPTYAPAIRAISLL